MSLLKSILSSLRRQGSDQAETPHQHLLGELEKSGFFEGLTDEQIERVREAVKQYGAAGIYGEPRCVHADSEDLAEGQLGNFLKRVESFLSRHGVPQLVTAENFSHLGYSVHINGQHYVIWNESEAENAWGLSEVRTLMLLNDLLRSANSSERAYGLYGGNDFHVFFLTPRPRNLVASQPGVAPKDLPYEAHEHPLFETPQFQSASP